MSDFTIGILGGMGPRATIEFQGKLLNQFSGSDQSIPRIVCSNNGLIPDRSSFLLNDGADPLDILVTEARMLSRSGANIVCMPCNTAHSPKILARLMARVPLPVLDMPAACMLQAEKMKVKTLLILGTEGTNVGKIFDSRAVNTTCAYPNQVGQVLIDELIKDIKKGLVPNQVQLNQLSTIISDARADAVVLGCTELSILAKNITEVPVIDSMDILAKTCADLCIEYTNEKENI